MTEPAAVTTTDAQLGQKADTSLIAGPPRERRAQITSEIARVERELDEAVAALGIEPSPPDEHALSDESAR